MLLDTSEGIRSTSDQPRGWDVEPGIEPEDVVLFLPRVILAVPKYTLVVVFWPVRELIRVLERHAVIEHIEYVLYWNEDQTIGWYPFLSFFSDDGFTGGVIRIEPQESANNGRLKPRNLRLTAEKQRISRLDRRMARDPALRFW